MKLFKALPLICALALFAPAANAAMVLQLNDGVAPTVTITDGGAGDLDAAAGVILFSGSVGSFNVNFSSGISTSTPDIAELTMSSSVNSLTGGTLSILLTDTGFLAPAGDALAVSLAGTFTNGTVAFQSYIDNTDMGLQTDQLANFGPFVSDGSLQSLSSPAQGGLIVTSPPFSLSWAAQITQAPGGFTPSLTATVNVSSAPVASSPIPEPSAALCFGLGGLLVGGAIRRRSL